MVAKTSPARRAAFLRALAATGNHRIAAEHARVSRSWAVQLKRADPDFRAACDAAVAEARARLRAGGADAAPPAGWGSRAGEELVLDWGADGRPAQVKRARLHQWTPRLETRFLAVLASTCNVRMAAGAVGMSTNGAYRRRLQWSAFRRRWADALAHGHAMIESELLRRACDRLEGRAGEDAAVAALIDHDAPIAMSIDDMLQLLRQHWMSVHGRAAKREHRNWGRAPDIEAARAAIGRRNARRG